MRGRGQRESCSPRATLLEGEDPTAPPSPRNTGICSPLVRTAEGAGQTNTIQIMHSSPSAQCQADLPSSM